MTKNIFFATTLVLLTSSVAYAQPAPSASTPSQAISLSPAILKSFDAAGIPLNDTQHWVSIGVQDGATAAALNHIFDQATSNPNHTDTDNPEFFNNIHPITNALNAKKFTLNDLERLITEHHKAEDAGEVDEVGPDLTNVIIDSAIKIHHGLSPQAAVNELIAQQRDIDNAEKQEQDN